LFVDAVDKGANTLATLADIKRIGGRSDVKAGGYMDDVRYYNRALSQADITALYNGGAGTEKENCATASDDPLYTVCTYTGVGVSTFTPPAGVTSVSALVVAGGGAGGGYIGGGGGAGGLISTSSYSVSGAITVTVGAGGTAPVEILQQLEQMVGILVLVH
jgi:hypothetical protein